MSNTSSMAQRAGNLLHEGITTTGIGKETFARKMLHAGLPFIAIEIPSDIESCDIVVFQDGSGFFADEADGLGWTPWVLDSYHGADWQDELLPVWAEVTDVLDFSSSDRFLPRSAVAGKALDAHLTICARAHSDPPEGLRPYLVTSYREFEWRDSSGAQTATEKLSQIAAVLCPTAVEITIHGECAEGRTPTQEASEANTLSMLADMGSRFSDDATMEAYYEGRPYAEITDSGSDFDSANRANQVLTPISKEILARFGNPIGWETDYNDGASNRISGYSAQSQSEVFEIQHLSAHARVGAAAAVIAFMRELEMEEDLNTLLETNGFSRIE